MGNWPSIGWGVEWTDVYRKLFSIHASVERDEGALMTWQRTPTGTSIGNSARVLLVQHALDTVIFVTWRVFFLTRGYGKEKKYWDDQWIQSVREKWHNEHSKILSFSNSSPSPWRRPFLGMADCVCHAGWVWCSVLVLMAPSGPRYPPLVSVPYFAKS